MTKDDNTELVQYLDHCGHSVPVQSYEVEHIMESCQSMSLHCFYALELSKKDFCSCNNKTDTKDDFEQCSLYQIMLDHNPCLGYHNAISCYHFRIELISFFDFFIGLFLVDSGLLQRLINSAEAWLAERIRKLMETDEDDIQFQIAYRKANFLFLENEFREKINGCERNIFIKFWLTYKAVNNYSELLVAKAKAAKCYGSCREEIYKLTEKYAFHLQNPSTESNASHWLEAQVKELVDERLQKGIKLIEPLFESSSSYEKSTGRKFNRAPYKSMSPLDKQCSTKINFFPTNKNLPTNKKPTNANTKN
ncbi:unnamed protein product [Oikopleura dioica]|uniref:Uncharacterized protein n=1 Tax=Oikopleura dioica TaxID=34765 RepID=E4X8L3_OIKDI|nr:unnamed protein product [Oikopleura dioica]